ncbi:uncharacterized protein PG986_006498 [Apiospora aurea]|uniref:Uncharacterized protein n=1 Tax=Apiospora aurea TaxID=335848 RepID=A0ABR1QKL5_9PEZI
MEGGFTDAATPRHPAVVQQWPLDRLSLASFHVGGAVGPERVEQVFQKRRVGQLNVRAGLSQPGLLQALGIREARFRSTLHQWDSCLDSSSDRVDGRIAPIAPETATLLACLDVIVKVQLLVGADTINRAVPDTDGAVAM